MDEPRRWTTSPTSKAGRSRTRGFSRTVASSTPPELRLPAGPSPLLGVEIRPDRPSFYTALALSDQRATGVRRGRPVDRKAVEVSVTDAGIAGSKTGSVPGPAFPSGSAALLLPRAPRLGRRSPSASAVQRRKLGASWRSTALRLSRISPTARCACRAGCRSRGPSSATTPRRPRLRPPRRSTTPCQASW